MAKIGRIIPPCFCKEATFESITGSYVFECPVHNRHCSWKKSYMETTKARNLEQLKKELIGLGVIDKDGNRIDRKVGE